jgi:transcriptional regulator with XRE-family HTH domain
VAFVFSRTEVHPPVQRFNGHNLRAVRKAQKLKKEQLGLAVGRGYEAIHLYECNHRRPPVEVLERLANVLNVPISAFFDDDRVPV